MIEQFLCHAPELSLSPMKWPKIISSKKFNSSRASHSVSYRDKRNVQNAKIVLTYESGVVGALSAHDDVSCSHSICNRCVLLGLCLHPSAVLNVESIHLLPWLPPSVR